MIGDVNRRRRRRRRRMWGLRRELERKDAAN